MEGILGIVTKVGECFVAPICSEISYLSEYQRNIESLRQQTDKLNDMRYDMQQSVNAAIRNGDEIKITIDRWLTDVEHIITEAEQLEIESTLEDRCLRGWSPNWLSRYRLSKNAFKKTLVIKDLQEGKPIEDVSFRLPPLNIEFPPTLTRARPEVEGVLLHPKSKKNDKVVGGSTSTVNQKIVERKKTVNDIIAQQRDPVKQIIFQQKEAVDQIFDALQDDDCEIIGVHGLGGIGKTTLAKEIGKMAKACGLFNEVVLAVVSQNQDVRKIQGEIADILGVWLSEESERGRAGRLYQRLTGKERILLVLDDVWASVNLTAIGIPYGAEGKSCKIVITTRQRNICSIMGFQKRKEIPLKLLSEEASYDLLKKNAELTDSVSPPLDNVAMEVARECGGLPLAVVTVGRALRGKDLEEWKAALQQIKKSKPLNINGIEKDVFSCINLSYEHLKSEEAKACLLFCCLFPEDHEIKIEDIARYGMGKGLFTNVDTMEEARRQTRWIIRNLKDSCLLLDGGKEDCVKMHDMVRDFAILIASEKRNGFLVKSGLGLKEWPNWDTSEEKVIISLMANHIQALPEDLSCPQLEMLLLGENDGFEAITNGFFEGMTMLRVLDLSERIGVRSLKSYFRSSPSIQISTNSLTFPLSFEALVNLRTLYLEHCKLADIAVLGKLKKLEILSLYGSDIKELPNEIGELSNLRLLDLNFCQNLEIVPTNLISRLIRLEELYMGESFRDWEVAKGIDEERSKASLSEVTSLSHLTNLCVQVSNPKSLPTNLHIQNLQKFEIAIGKSYNMLTCYPNSRSLYLQEIKTSIPESVKDILQTTEDLTIFCLDDDLVRSVLDVDLGGLNSLKSLTVFACVEIVFVLDTPARGAPAVLSSLEKLHLRNLEDLKYICRGSIPIGSLEELKILTVRSCRSLKTIVTVPLVQRLLNLKEIEVEHCDEVNKIFELHGIVNEKECLLLSDLREIRLYQLPELHSIWSGLDPISPLVSPIKLSVVEISYCRKLRYVFPYSVAQNLLLLEVLKLNGCLKLEAIVAKAQGLSENQNQPVCFPNLKLIEVKECRKLKSLFSVVEARNLRQLKEIKVTNCAALVELISHEERGEEEETEHGTILLPRLNSIQMTGLHSINRLCTKPFAVDLPSLEELVLVNCPKLETFACDARKYGFEGTPQLKRAQIGEDTIYGEAALQLFNQKKEKEITKDGNSQEMKPLLKHSQG